MVRSICLEQGADLNMAQWMPLPLTVSSFSKILIGFTSLVSAYPGSPGKGPLNGCVCASQWGVVPERSSHRLIVHARLVLLLAPQSRHGLGVEQLEDASLAVGPLDVARTVVAALQQRQQELPQVLGRLTATPHATDATSRRFATMTATCICNVLSVQWWITTTINKPI